MFLFLFFFILCFIVPPILILFMAIIFGLLIGSFIPIGAVIISIIIFN